MQDISVGIYSIRIYDSKMNEDIQVEENEYSISLSKIIKDYFNTMRNKGRIYKKEQSLVIVDKIITEATHEICGRIKTGDYGYESELYDVTEKKSAIEEQNTEDSVTENLKKVYTKPSTMAEVLPFIFKFYLMDHKNKKLYVALQRFGQFGIKIRIEKELNKFFKERYPEYKNLSIKIHDLVSERVINEYYKKNGFKSLTLTRYELPKDLANVIENNGANPKDFMIEYKIKPKKKGLRIPQLKGVSNFFSSERKDVRNVIEIKQNKEFQYNDISAELMIDGKPKKLDFSNFLKFKVYEVIDVKREENGHPNEKELLNEMERILKETIKNIELI
ncbi:hypothetical protein F350042L8_33150 [Fusobacterium ulcerans]|uniref:hypothetical protein n=1 Tax=Fusobacterium ulcerans TaxID=861 RepID=UPI0034A80C5B